MEDCTFFKDLPISDRLTFVQRRGLCYGCFGVRHGALNCSFKKACGVDGCKLTHHRLLHKGKTPAEKNARSHTLRADRRQIAFKVIRVDALDANGEAVPVNVLWMIVLWMTEVIRRSFEKALHDDFGLLGSDRLWW